MPFDLGTPPPAIARPAPKGYVRKNGLLVPNCRSPLVPASMMVNPFVFGGAAALPFSLDFVERKSAGSGAATQTVSAIGFGAEPTGGETRYIIATGGIFNIQTISAVTIGGVSATLITSAVAASNDSICWIAVALVPTGTSGDIVITYGDSGGATSVATYRMMNPNSITPTDFKSVTTHSSGLTDLSLNVEAGGGAVAVTQNLNGGAATWTGLTESHDLDTNSNEWNSGASQSGLSAETPRTVTMQGADTTPGNQVGCSASWR